MLVMPTGWELTTKVRTNTQVCMAHDTATKVHRQPPNVPSRPPLQAGKVALFVGRRAGYADSPAHPPGSIQR
jgi:hypothetical protein